MRELLDLGSAADVLKKIASGDIRVTTIESTKPSPFASALLFSYIANYIYEGDAPLAERRAQALAIDQSQLFLCRPGSPVESRRAADKWSADHGEVSL